MAEVNDAATVAKDQLSEVVNNLRPQEDVNVVVLTDSEGYEYTYTQRKLTFFTKLAFFSILGNAIDKATSENNGLSIQNVTQSSNAELLGLLTKVVQYVPSLIKDIFCLSMGVSDEEKPVVKALLDTIDDDEGFKMLEVFVAQNAEEIKAFFTERLQPIVKQIGGVLKEASVTEGKASSKPSKPTRRATPKK